MTPGAGPGTILPMKGVNLRVEETPDPFGFLPGASPLDAWRHRCFPALRPIDFIGGDRPPTVNLLVARFDRNGLSLETPRALLFVVEVCRRAGAGLRLITLDGPCEPDFLPELLAMEGRPPTGAEFFDGSVRHTRDTYRRLVVGADDLFIATDWGSSRIARFLSLRGRFVWILQSCEPDGFSEGDGKDLVVESMRDFSDFVPVFASSGLADRLVENGWIRGDGPRLFLPARECVGRAPGAGGPPPGGRKILHIGEGPGYRTMRALEGVDAAIRAGHLSTRDWRIVMPGGARAPSPDGVRCDGRPDGRDPGSGLERAPAFCDGGRAGVPEAVDFPARRAFLRRVDLGVFAGPWVEDDPALAEIRSAGGRAVAGSFESADEVARRIAGALAGAGEPPPSGGPPVNGNRADDDAAGAVAGMFRATGDHVPSV